LEFDDYHGTFLEYVFTSLISNKAPVLYSLGFSVREQYHAKDIGIWIGIAFARHVRKLALWLSFEELDYPTNFPDRLCLCNDSLEILELGGSILLDFYYPVCFKSLRELHLTDISFENEESISNLLCGCPSLEDLVVRRPMLSQRPKTFTFWIAVPSLQRLTLEDDVYREGGGGYYVIDAPYLKYLNLKDFNGHEFCVIENSPKLVEAKICDIAYITNESILLSLTSVKRLSLYISPLKEIKYPTGKIFDQLLSLELCTNYEKELQNRLSLMLDGSPKLQTLKLIYLWEGTIKADMVDGKWNKPKCVPECLLFHLKTFVWTGYQWQREDENEVATYILKNARHLKKATLSTKPIKSTKLEKLEKRREMLDELASVVRASHSCQLVFETAKHRWYN
ncbi:FBD-associated F-box protein At3g49020-like, partial [Capsella rubella]|uniref:FBD-associated F-box protein At3g49020-like n=1 Tax=Capsella rubella TaxID=81985 RepID=UPI000CD5B84E